MLNAVNPADTRWLSWSEIQRERIRIDRAAVTRKRDEVKDRLEAALSAPKDETEAAARNRSIAAGLKPFEDLLQKLQDEEAGLSADPSEPAFQVGHISWKTRSRVQALYSAGKVEDAALAMELLARHGCRGHRAFVDGNGREIPFKFESSKGDFPILAEETFEVYAASGIVEALAAVIMDFNTAGRDARKN